MIVLGIETATDVCSVGILTPKASIERTIRESRIHSEKLLVILHEALEEAEVGWTDIQGVALSSGPGSFTGLRIGASTVKGLLSAYSRPFVLIPTFDGIRTLYQQHGQSADGFVICLDAKQDEWYVQDITSDGDAHPMRVMGTDGVLQLSAGRTIVTDVPGRFGDHAVVSDLRQWCSGAAIATLGRERLEQGKTDDVRSFEPAYWKEFIVRTIPKAVTPHGEAKEK